MEVGVYNFNYDFKSLPQEIRLILSIILCLSWVVVFGLGRCLG